MSEENIRHVNYASDFRVVFSFPDGKLPAYPWHIELNTPDTPAYNTYVASFDGTTYHRCMPIDESSVVVLVDNHRLAPGVLCYRIKRDVPDSLFPDGEMNITTPGCTSIELWDGVSEELPAEQINTIIALLKGDAGQIVDFTADVDQTTGTPNVVVTLGGTPEERAISLKFSGLKGETPKITADDDGNIFIDGVLLTDILANAIKTFDTIESVDQKVRTEKERAEGVERKLREDLTDETRRAKEAEQANAQAIETINNARGTANGLATLDGSGHVPASQLPAYVDDVLEFQSAASFPRPGESGKIYVALDTNKTYRWGGSDYAEISESLALGETNSTAYPGDKGKKNADDIAAETIRATEAETALGQRIDEFAEKDPLFTTWKNRSKIELGDGASSGVEAVAIGQRAIANDYSVAIGQDAKASGATSVALGSSAEATKYREIALGAYNKSREGVHLSVADSSAQPTDKKNCFEILDNGTLRIPKLPNKEADGLGDLQGYLADLAGGGALRPLYEKIEGVKYNPQTKFYEIYKDQGGLDDVTEEQMQRIYNAGHIWGPATMADKKNPIPLQDAAIKQTDIVYDFTYLFARSDYKVICLSKYGLSPGKLNYTFYNCRKLERIVGGEILIGYAAPFGSQQPFRMCPALVFVHIKGLKQSIDFKESPLLSVDDYTDSTPDAELSSLGYLVKYAANTSAITVTLHATAFDKVPETLKQKATAKNISIAKAL